METIFTIAALVANWMIFTKMGIEGWKSLIPIYGTYCEFEKLYGDGWKCLWMLVPIYGIYIAIKAIVDLAHAFNKSTGFAVGLVLIYPVFGLMLAFGKDTFRDGSEALQDDILKNTFEDLAGKAEGAFKKETSSEILDAVAKLEKLHEDGVITDEEYETKKSELIGRL